MDRRQDAQLQGPTFTPCPRNRKVKSGVGRTNWDPRLVAMAEGFYRRAAGGVAALIAERNWSYNFATLEDLAQFMDVEFPAWRSFDPNPTARASIQKRLMGRVYNTICSGVAARGPNHDPRVQAALSAKQLEAERSSEQSAFSIRDYVERGLKVPRHLLPKG